MFQCGVWPCERPGSSFCEILCKPPKCLPSIVLCGFLVWVVIEKYRFFKKKWSKSCVDKNKAVLLHRQTRKVAVKAAFFLREFFLSSVG